MAVNMIPSTFEPSTFSPFFNMPSHPMHPMHHMPMHPMHHTMPMHPMHPMNVMPSMNTPFVHPMNTPFFHHEMSTPFFHPMSTPFFHHEMNTPFFHHEMNTPFFHHEMNTPFFHKESMHTPSFFNMHSMHPMNHWMRHQLPREIRDVVFRPMNTLEYTTFVNPIVYHPDGSRMLRLAFEVKGFKPEEVKIEVLAKERAVVVEAKHEVKEKEHVVTRHYSRKFVLPEEVHVDLSKVELKSVMTHDGLLVLESVLPRITPEELKTIREKVPSKHTPYMPTGPITPAGHHAVSIPVKMN